MNNLPPELFYRSIYSLTEEVEPANHYIALAPLMLVARRWRALIDEDPYCWRVISSVHPRKLVERAISKSGSGKILLIDFRRGQWNTFVRQWFTDIVLPHFDRWQELRLDWPLWLSDRPHTSIHSSDYAASAQLSQVLQSRSDAVRKCLSAITLNLPRDAVPGRAYLRESPVSDRTWITSLIGEGMRKLTLANVLSTAVFPDQFLRCLASTPNLEDLTYSSVLPLEPEVESEASLAQQDGIELTELKTLELRHSIGGIAELLAMWRVNPSHLKRCVIWIRQRDAAEASALELLWFHRRLLPILNDVIENASEPSIKVHIQDDCLVTIGNGRLAFRCLPASGCTGLMLDAIETMVAGRCWMDVEIRGVETASSGGWHLWMGEPRFLPDTTRSLALHGCGSAVIMAILADVLDTDYLQGLEELKVMTPRPQSHYAAEAIQDSLASISHNRPRLQIRLDHHS